MRPHHLLLRSCGEDESWYGWTTMTALNMAMIGERTVYLSLALDSRLAIKTLQRLAATRERPPEVVTALRKILNWLTAIRTPGGTYSGLHSDTDYPRYEQIRTVEEVLAAFRDKRVLQKLNAIIRGKKASDRDIAAVIRFLVAVERRALYHYDDPGLGRAAV